MMIPHSRSPAELDTFFESIQIQSVPASWNLTGWEGGWTTMDARSGRCIRMSVKFVDQNPGWGIMSFHQTNPKTGITYNHMANIKGDVIFDPVFGVFFTKEGYFEYFSVKDAVIFS